MIMDAKEVMAAFGIDPPTQMRRSIYVLGSWMNNLRQHWRRKHNELGHSRSTNVSQPVLEVMESKHDKGEY